MDETFPSLFFESIEKYSSNKMIITQEDDNVFSYSDIADIAGRIMRKFQTCGLKKGDKIVVYTRMNVEALPLLCAAACLGIIWVPVDFSWPKASLSKVMESVSPKMIFCDHQRLLQVPADKGLSVVVFDDSENSRHPGDRENSWNSDCQTDRGNTDCQTDRGNTDSCPSYRLFSQWLDEDSSDSFSDNILNPKELIAQITPTDPIVILHTSGSTGIPKGIVLSHRALYKSSKLFKETFGLTSQDRVLITGELHTVTGLRLFLVCDLYTGYTILMPGSDHTIFALQDFIAKYGCTHVVTVPIFLKQTLQFKDRITLSCLKTLKCIASAGSILDDSLCESFYQAFQIPVFNLYGLTETSGLCAGTSWDTFADAHGSIGIPRGCDLEIVDSCDVPVPQGESGEIRIRSNQLMLGYYQNPELTAQVMRDGWFYTGDIGMVRHDGHIVLKGRKKNIIKNVYGELIQLEEVEETLSKHPQVQEVCVCEYSSQTGQEYMAAFVVSQIKPFHEASFIQDMRNFVAKELGNGKIPEIFLMKEILPRNAAGKVKREELRKEITVK